VFPIKISDERFVVNSTAVPWGSVRACVAQAFGGVTTRSRHSSASSRVAISVESTRSQNITGRWRRSPAASGIAGLVACVVGDGAGAELKAAADLPVASKFVIALSRRFRCSQWHAWLLKVALGQLRENINVTT
jgi:hypothetical protein